MSSMIGFDTLYHFPDQNTILEYLSKHPMTNDAFLTEKKIIETVAKFFANQSKVDCGVNLGVVLSLYEMNEKLHLPEMVLKIIQVALSQALKDCANGKPIPQEEKMEKKI